MGVNEWREEKEWPPPGAEMRRYYLHAYSRGKPTAPMATAHSQLPSRRRAAGLFLYNPLNPLVPTAGGGLQGRYANAQMGGRA